MKKFKLTKVIAVLLTCALSMMMVMIPAFAKGDEDDSVKLNPTDTAKADKAFEGSSTGLDGLSYSGGTFTWDNGKELDKLSNDEQKKQMKKFVKKVQEANLSADATSRLNDLLSNVDGDCENVDMSILLAVYALDQTKGDLVGGMNIIEGFLPYINLIIGVIAILLMSLLVLSTVIDLACIGLPAVRDMMLENASKDGNGGGGGASKPKAITYSAWATINEVEGGEGGQGSGKNAYWIYFKKRVFDYVILGICVSFLVLGGFSSFVSAFLEIGQGFLK